MKEIYQTNFGYPGGNCFAACIASIFECEISDIPNFTDLNDDNWADEIAKRLKPYNIATVAYDLQQLGFDWHPSGYYIGAVQSPRFDCLHAVVCFDGKSVWDPHIEQNAYDLSVKYCDVFYPIDPSKPWGFKYNAIL